MSTSPFTTAHRLRVKSLYKRMLVNQLNWTIRRDVWRQQAIEIRAEFERNRNVTDPRAVGQLLAAAEARLAENLHPDPYIVPQYPGGTKYERNIPPPMTPVVDHMAH
ncbi:NDUFB9, NADH-ubiquinone oxidoreductase [Clavulina sp. PMI_390]|nr:NDUFB9, NADH-ubiquinone oxidoreductase [Clavulina sp. PMI_390]